MSVYTKANKIADNVTELNVLALDGVVATVGTPSITVLEVNSDGNVRYAIGATVPTNGDAGYAHGCLFVNSAGGSGTTWYVNEGSNTSATFTALDTASGFGVPIAATDATSTTGTSLAITSSALTTGSVFSGTVPTATFTTGGSVFNANMNAAVAGNAFVATTTGVYTGTGLMVLTANSATTGSVAAISGTGLTSGFALQLTGGTAMTSTGALISANLGAATSGSGLDITTTGVYADTTGLFNITAANATTGRLAVISGAGLTTGFLLQLSATAATLTGTGRYLVMSDGGVQVFGVGQNGHVYTTQTTAPTIIVTTQNGITAAAITAGSTDVCGTITTTGTNNNGGNTVLTITFNATYTAAPKSVNLQAVNQSAATASVFVTQTATTFIVNIVASASSGATPSWTYQVIA